MKNVITKKIVAIGGGSILRRETVRIDKRIIELSGKKKPNFLFIPTASSDEKKYCRDIKKYFGDELGCKVKSLLLIRKKLTHQEIIDKIVWADIIYVGGGNTLKMMRLWRRLGVDVLLVNAYKCGKVMCGTSAGALCWFALGHSDSMSFYNEKNWKYIKVRGLGLINVIGCPHYNSETLGVPRHEAFGDMIKKNGTKLGLAIDNRCAVEFIDNKMRIIADTSEASAYFVFKGEEGEIVEQKIKKSNALMPAAFLFS